MPTTIPLYDGDRVMFTGDSTSTPATGFAWFDLANTGFVATVNAQFSPPAATVHFATMSGARAVATGVAATHVPVALPGAITVFPAGRGSTVIADLDADITNEMNTNMPSVVFIAIGVNDVVTSGPPTTTPAVFRASYDSTLAKIKAWNPATRIVCLSIYSYGEVWAAGPVWNNGATDALVDGLNAQIQASAAAAGAVYVDTRAQLLLWEVINNPTQQFGGFAIQLDGKHLTTPAGKQQIGNYVLPHVVVVP